MEHYTDNIARFVFILLACCLCGTSSCADEAPPINPESGILITPNQSTAITIAGDCRVVTNHMPKTTIFIQTKDVDRWPDLAIRDEKGDKLIEVEPCKDI